MKQFFSQKYWFVLLNALIMFSLGWYIVLMAPSNPNEEWIVLVDMIINFAFGFTVLVSFGSLVVHLVPKIYILEAREKQREAREKQREQLVRSMQLVLQETGINNFERTMRELAIKADIAFKAEQAMQQVDGVDAQDADFQDYYKLASEAAQNAKARFWLATESLPLVGLEIPLKLADCLPEDLQKAS
jgi:hypothetical protein